MSDHATPTITTIGTRAEGSSDGPAYPAGA
jgi:hypothetical protein